MSNRKLMGALSILLLAALVMSIGCGDGKTNKRENFRKGAAATNPAGNPKDIKNKSQAMDTIDSSMTGYADEGGQAIAQQSLEAGNYELVEIMGYARYDRNQDAVRAIAIGAVNKGALSEGSSQQVGMMGKDSDSPRTVEVPLSFSISGQTLNPANEVIYSMQLGQVGVESKIVHSLGGSGKSEISILKAIAGHTDRNNAYILQLAGGKKGEVHVRKVSVGIRITVTTREMIKAKTGNKDSELIKRMAFTYRLTKANQQTAAVQPAPTAAEPAKADAPKPEDFNVGAP